MAGFNMENMPDLAKDYLFRCEFDFNNDEGKELADWMSVSCKKLYTNGLMPGCGGNCILVFDEFQDFRIFSYWMSHLMKPNATDEEVDARRFNMTVKFYASDLTTVAYKLKFTGVIPHIISELSLDVESAGKLPLKLQCTFEDVE